MLSKLEEIRQFVGRKKINEDGISMTTIELYKLFEEYCDEFRENYVLKGHVRAFNTVFDIQTSTILGTFCNWYDKSISIHRKDMRGSHLNDLCLYCNQYEKADIKVFYSECDWIDIHIRLSENDYSTSICLCFPPKGKE